MLKKSSSILQELGLDQQARAEARAAARKAKQQQAQPVEHPAENVAAAANVAPVAAGETKVDEAPVKKAVEKITPTAAKSPPAAAMRPAIAAPALATAPPMLATPIRPPTTQVPESAVRCSAVEQGSAVPSAASAPEGSAVPPSPAADFQPRRQPPALGAPQLNSRAASLAAEAPNRRALACAAPASIAAPVPQPVSTSSAPPKPSGTAGRAAGSTSSLQQAPRPLQLSAGLAPELAGLRWPSRFLSEPRGARVELREDGGRATRESGVGRGLCFLGPLQLESAAGAAYFEIEILELEAGANSQTMAMGFVTSLPVARPLLAERATDLGRGSFLVGYDLPKLYGNGEMVSKVSGWRPLKELSLGDRVGLLLRQNGGSPEFSVYVNGARKVSVPLPAAAAEALAVGADLWGVVDVYGAVRSVRLRRAPAGPSPSRGDASSAITTPARGVVRPLDEGAEQSIRKRLRLPMFPECNCTVHLIKHGGSVVHVPNTDFCIGRDTKVVSLALDTEEFPNMVSRTHARIVTNDGGVHVIDCKSLNGTWLNGSKVASNLLRSGDSLVIGNPSQAPPDFRFSVDMPDKTQLDTLEY